MTDIRVPQQAGCIEYVEKRSRFLGYLWPVDDEPTALALIKDVKKKHWDATHNVYAYTFNDIHVARYSDDGEPSGTAGLPVLDVLNKNKVTNALCVVTRYFGGVMLGAGGLVRAYGTTAKQALDAAGITTLAPWQRLHFDCDYALLESIRRLVAHHGGTEDAVEYTDKVSLELALLTEEIQSFSQALTQLSNGQIQIVPADVVMRRRT